MNEKSCSKCGDVKPLTEFYSQPAGKYGVRSRCKPCDQAQIKAAKDRRPVEEKRAAAKDYYARVLGDKRRTTRAAYRAANPLPSHTPFKVCPKCGENKRRDTDYYWNGGRPVGYCKPCHGKYQWERQKARREGR